MSNVTPFIAADLPTAGRAMRSIAPRIVGATQGSPNTHQPKLPHRVTLSRSEGSVCMGVEMLRGVYTERSECAQHDRVPLALTSPGHLLSCSFRDDESGECLLKQGAVFFQPGRQLEVRAELFHRFAYGKTRGIGRNLEEGASRLVEVDGMEVFTINDGSDVSHLLAQEQAPLCLLLIGRGAPRHVLH